MKTYLVTVFLLIATFCTLPSSACKEKNDKQVNEILADMEENFLSERAAVDKTPFWLKTGNRATLLETLINTILNALISGVSDPTLFIAASSGSAVFTDDLSMSTVLTGVYVYGVNNITFSTTATSTGLSITLTAPSLEFDVDSIFPIGTITTTITVYEVPITIVSTKTFLIENFSTVVSLVTSGLTISSATADTTIGTVTSSLNVTISGVDVSDSVNTMLDTYFVNIFENVNDDVNTSIASLILGYLDL